ncbi:hypothetical protein V1478_004477 [Vespula squamosa]|uniref:Uncharacterized protein n=1 Tax=Vespula squamosa TaxID=30214 RepID=A0ABD2BGN2_VESSQ
MDSFLLTISIGILIDAILSVKLEDHILEKTVTGRKKILLGYVEYAFSRGKKNIPYVINIFNNKLLQKIHMNENVKMSK